MFEICTRCYMPSTRPQTPFREGVCQACTNFDTRMTVDWKKRLEELGQICDRHRRKDGAWDCFLPVSGGKDSHAMVYWLKEVMGMNPLLITAGDPFRKTEAGRHNYENLSSSFGCDQILASVSSDLLKRLIKSSFEEWLDPLRFVEQVLNTLPFMIGTRLGIKLSFKGESPFVYGGSKIEERTALERLLKRTTMYDVDFWMARGARREELNAIRPFTDEELRDRSPECYYLSYFVPWSSLSNVGVAKRFGFVDLHHEWNREGCTEDFEQIDSVAYLTHIWLKYPKYGFQRASDIVARRLREGAISREDARRLILDHDKRLDRRALEDFIAFIGCSVRDFWDVVEPFWNTEIFEKIGPVWEMKVPRFAEP